jgi:hypothetical protein
MDAEAGLIVTFPLVVIVPALLNTQDDPTVKAVKLTLLPDPMVN